MLDESIFSRFMRAQHKLNGKFSVRMGEILRSHESCVFLDLMAVGVSIAASLKYVEQQKLSIWKLINTHTQHFYISAGDNGCDGRLFCFVGRLDAYNCRYVDTPLKSQSPFCVWETRRNETNNKRHSPPAHVSRLSPCGKNGGVGGLCGCRRNDLFGSIKIT